MSFWMRVGVKIEDLECFKQSCRQNSVRFDENQDTNFKMQGFAVHATLTDTKVNERGRMNTGYLVKDGGGFKVIVDNDPHYSSLTKRLGKNGGKLTRDYTSGVISKGVVRGGGMINSVKEQPDGSVVIKATAL